MQRVLTTLVLVAILVLGCLTGTPASAAVIYFTDESRVLRSNPAGATPVELSYSGSSCFALCVAFDTSTGKIYWTIGCTAPESSIFRADSSGSNLERVVSAAIDSAISGIALNLAQGKIYWAQQDSASAIKRANLNGSSAQTIVASAGISVYGVAIDATGGKLYWTTFTDGVAASGKIRRSDLVGQNVTDLVTGLQQPCGLALDVGGQKIYWADLGTGKVQRANLADGQNVENLVTGVTGVLGISLDLSAGKMYWTDAAGRKVQRANLNGSNVEDVLTGLNYPSGIVLHP